MNFKPSTHLSSLNSHYGIQSFATHRLDRCVRSFNSVHTRRMASTCAPDHVIPRPSFHSRGPFCHILRRERESNLLLYHSSTVLLLCCFAVVQYDNLSSFFPTTTTLSRSEACSYHKAVACMESLYLEIFIELTCSAFRQEY
jgi:hypothetical protein